jgi:gliding motility-associated protein GldL
MAILSPKVMNFAYGMGAAIVILGALFKITHLEFGPLNGTIMLTVGLLVEAAIFALSAFEEPAKDLDWTLVYPELAGGEVKAKAKKEDPKDAQGLLSQKLDNLLKDAKIDGELMSSLSNSIKNFEGAAKGIAPTVDAITSQKKYADEMVNAAASLSELNNIYKMQVEGAQKNAEANQAIAENAAKLKEQMQSMTSNISSLNAVYGGMLSAMQNKG